LKKKTKLSENETEREKEEERDEYTSLLAVDLTDQLETP
jgi:hypothetical protein